MIRPVVSMALEFASGWCATKCTEQVHAAAVFFWTRERSVAKPVLLAAGYGAAALAFFTAATEVRRL